MIQIHKRNVFTYFLVVMLAVTFLSIFIPDVKAQPINVSASGTGGYFTIKNINLGTSIESNDYALLAIYPDDTVSFEVVPPVGTNFDYWELWTDGGYTGTFYINPYVTVVLGWFSSYEMKAFFTIAPTPTPVPTPTPDTSTFTASTSGSGGIFSIIDLTTNSSTTGLSTASLSFSTGDTIQFSVTPPTGYLFSHWTDSVSSYYTSIVSQTLTSNQALTAHFIVASGNYHYSFHGPYIEDGNLFNGVVNVTVNYLNLPSIHYFFNGSSGVETLIQLYSPTPITTVTWNISNTMSTQRTYLFSPTTTSGELWIYVPDILDPLVVTNSYGVSVSDLAGLTNAYVETTKNIEGYQRIIERQLLDPINAMPFWLVQFTQYNLVIDSDQGTFTFGLPADTIGSKSYAVTKDMVVQNFTGYNMTVSATHTSATNIDFSYVDPSGLTTQVYTEVDFYETGTWHVIYSQTDYSSLQSFSLVVDSATTYYYNVTAIRNGLTLTWVIIVSPTNSAYQFDLTNGFNLFGTWPIEARNLLGLVIVIVFFGIGSYKDSEFFAGVSAVVALFLWAIGLLVIPVAAISMVLVIVAFMYFHKGKQEIREP